MDSRPILYNAKKRPEYLFDTDLVKIVNNKDEAEVIIDKPDHQVTLNDVYLKTSVFTVSFNYRKNIFNIYNSVINQTFPQHLINIIICNVPKKDIPLVRRKCPQAMILNYTHNYSSKCTVYIRNTDYVLKKNALERLYLAITKRHQCVGEYTDANKNIQVFPNSNSTNKVVLKGSYLEKEFVNNPISFDSSKLFKFHITVIVKLLENTDLQKTINSIRSQTFYYLKTHVDIVTMSDTIKERPTAYRHIYGTEHDIDFGYVTFLDSGNYYTMHDYLDNMINFAFLSKASFITHGLYTHTNYHFVKIAPKDNIMRYAMFDKIQILGLEKPEMKINKTNDLLYLIVPYRNREVQLKQYVEKMKPYLESLNIPHKIVIVNQSDNDKFRSALLINIGVKYIMSQEKGDNYYFCKNDIDTIPIKPNNYYRPENGVINNLYGYYDCLAGTYIFNPNDFVKMNGLSNSFEGWGGEDTDAWARAIRAGLIVDTRCFSGRNSQNYIELKGAPDDNKPRLNSPEFKRNLWLSMFDQYDQQQDGLEQLDISSVQVEEKEYILINANTSEILKTFERR